ncbi:unnamed protein product [Haemonchus placei]|uniref:NTR domain-containing protein n=1 Tax=Haemonchus placei TaxID=6290 RepID=A0A0N4W9U5_HAEPC|nr:unnamed protein product [Haemonchus placei]
MQYLIAFIACVAASEACSCLPFNSLKETFCASDFVTHVKVIAKDDPNEDSDGLEDVEYIVEHICVYRPQRIKLLTVTHVKVIAKDDPNEDSDGLEDVEYIVEHICVYRKPANVKILPKEISTASNSAACGIELDVGQEYLLGGKLAKILDLLISV